MKKFGLSLEIPSDEEKDQEEPTGQELGSYESNEDQEYEESEQESYNRSEYSQEKEQPTMEQEEDEELLDPQPPTINKKPAGFGFGGGLGLTLDAEESDKENSEKLEGSRKESEEIPAEAAEDDGIQVEGMESTGDISYKWVEALKNVQIAEKGIPFSQFYKSFSLRETAKEFKLIRRLTETDLHKSQIMKRKKGKDRYSDLGPFKHSQVKLRSNTKVFDAEVDNYINANYIRSARQRHLFIATQGPLETTFLNFYRMVWQEKVSMVFMLCPLKEDDKKKCSEYWPHEGTDQVLEIEGQFIITFEELVQSEIDIVNK